MPPFSPDTIAAAETLLGIAYTQAERALMADGLETQLALTLRRRATPLPPELGPATRFDPRLPGFAMPSPGPLVLPHTPTPPLPGNDIDIAYAPIATLAAWLRAGALTATRLTRLYLGRIASLNPTLNAFALIDADGALAHAAALDRLAAANTWLGPLHGIPYAAKDIIDTANLETAWGAEPFRGRIPATDATVVQRLHAAGAILLGKTSVGALAYGDVWYGGQTRNPWNPGEGARGSSAGSASATAAALAAFTLGTETLGSIVAPSARCGATGLRPTHGRVSRHGVMPLCWSLDKIGPIARTVADTALVLAAINGPDPADPFNIPAPFAADLTADLAPLRLGYYPADYALPGIHPLDHAALETARTLCPTLVPLTRPDLPYDSLMAILAAEAAAAFEDLTLTDQDDLLTRQDPQAWPNAFRRARFLSAIDHIQLDRLRRLVMQVMAETFTQVDLVIGPALLGPMLTITNFTGHPCLCLPAGLAPSPARNLAGEPGPGPALPVPHPVCLWSPLFNESPLLALGAALERTFALTTRPPLG